MCLPWHSLILSGTYKLDIAHPWNISVLNNGVLFLTLCNPWHGFILPKIHIWHCYLLDISLSLTMLYPCHTHCSYHGLFLSNMYTWHCSILDISLSFNIALSVTLFNPRLNPVKDIRVDWTLLCPWKFSVLQKPLLILNSHGIALPLTLLVTVYPGYCSTLEISLHLTQLQCILVPLTLHPGYCSTLGIALPLTLLVTVYPGYCLTPWHCSTLDTIM